VGLQNLKFIWKHFKLCSNSKLPPRNKSVDNLESFNLLLFWQRKYCTAGQNTGPGLLHPTGHEPTPHVHYIVRDKQHNTCYTHDSLPSAHTPTDFV